jgi:A/G-specific adenine glycosylase
LPSRYDLPPKGCPALSAEDRRKISWLRQRLLRWAEANTRDFPWRRRSATVYEQVCVEVLLQQTRAETVAREYDRFFSRYPSWGSLRAASLSELEQALRPLGLWRRRARNLMGLAEFASASDGRFPLRQSQHRHIPAVGQYVSNAISVFQHGKRRPLLDVNMARVLERVLRPRQQADLRSDPFLQQASHWLVQRGDPKRVNWAILDFAASICLPKRPKCEICPLARCCSYFQQLRAPVDSRVSSP